MPKTTFDGFRVIPKPIKTAANSWYLGLDLLLKIVTQIEFILMQIRLTNIVTFSY